MQILPDAAPTGGREVHGGQIRRMHQDPGAGSRGLKVAAIAGRCQDEDNGRFPPLPAPAEQTEGAEIASEDRQSGGQRRRDRPRFGVRPLSAKSQPAIVR